MEQRKSELTGDGSGVGPERVPTDAELYELAETMRKQSYAPYSRFCVGAALLSKDGRIFTGCNMENASYSATVCAERNAFGAAVAAGAREFSKIAIAGGGQGQSLRQPCMPCGVCRQVMREFCGDDFVIVVGDGNNLRRCLLGDLLPGSFTADFLKK